MSVTFKGMTWSHPRGYDPMVACSRVWEEKTGVRVEWDKRSLQDFESFPVEELARLYDFMVIDHPHVGQVTVEGCLLPLDQPGREAELAALAAGSVGPSFPSYVWAGRPWALPVDAATQVLAYRPDRLAAPPRTLAEVMALAGEGRVSLPLCPPHAVQTFFSLAANLGHPCRTEGPPFVDRAAGIEVWGILRELAARIDPGDVGRDPIAAFERMAGEDSPVDCIPYTYGYVSYAWEGFRPHRLAFADMPTAGRDGPCGSALGGTGIAVSARTRHPAEALDFAFWIASGEVQRGPYAGAGGQPGHAEAWEDAAVNAASGDFYRATRATLDGAYLRPRHDGYMRFPEPASLRILEGLERRESAGPVLDDLDRLFADSFI